MLSSHLFTRISQKFYYNIVWVDGCVYVMQWNMMNLYIWVYSRAITALSNWAGPHVQVYYLVYFVLEHETFCKWAT